MRKDSAVSSNEIPEPLADSELVRLIVAGDRELFRVVIDKHKVQIYRLMLRQVRDSSIAEELSQEVFIRAYKGLSGFKSEAKLSTWLTRIALNVANSYFTSRRHREWQREMALKQEHSSATTEEDSSAERERDATRLQQLVAQLKPIYREVIVLCFFERKTYDETAAVLGIPAGTVASRINRAFQLLREEFSKNKRED